MANDCLVTKLKGVVNNDNLDYFGYSKITLTNLGGFTDNTVGLQLKTVSVNDIKSLTSGASITSIDDSGYCNIKFNGNTSATFLIPKYSVTVISSLRGADLQYDLEQFCSFINLKTISIADDYKFINKNVDYVKQLKHLLNFSEINGALGKYTLSDLAEILTLQKIDVQYSRQITGDLSDVLNMPNLTYLKLDHTYITDTNNVLETLKTRLGENNVVYVPYTD